MKKIVNFYICKLEEGTLLPGETFTNVGLAHGVELKDEVRSRMVDEIIKVIEKYEKKMKCRA